MSRSPRVLLIAYYWPPSSGGGVMRWLRLANALAAQGVGVTVVVPEDADYPLLDEGLVARVDPRIDVLRRPIAEPYALYRRLTGRAPDVKMAPNQVRARDAGLPDQLARSVRANLFVPDARVGWVAPLAAWLRRHFARHTFDAVVTTGPPHSLHLIGAASGHFVARRWIADFRDPWTGIEYHDELGLLPPAAAAHRWLERQVLTRADRVVTVSPTWARDFEALGGRAVDVIENGFEAAATPKSPLAVSPFTIRHLGLFGADRASEGLVDGLSTVFAKRADLRLELIGSVDDDVTQRFASAGMADRVTPLPPLAHDGALAQMASAGVLLLSVAPGHDANGRIPGKLFEYLDAGRPVLAVCDHGSDVRAILDDVGGGLAAASDDPAGVAQALTRLLDDDVAPLRRERLRRYEHAEAATRYRSVLGI